MPAALDFLSTRLSCPAKLMSGPVPDDAALDAILKAATRVPDHGKLEPWRLILLHKPDLARLADLAQSLAGDDPERIAKGRGNYDAGQLAIAVIAAPKPAPKVPAVEQLLSAGALCFGLVAAATAAGWGACWLTGWTAHDAAFRTRAFGCTGDETVAGIVFLGTPTVPLTDRPRPDLSRLLQRGLQWS